MALQANIRLHNRVRKIQDTLEAANTKNALKLGTAMMEEFPNAPLAKVRFYSAFLPWIHKASTHL
jgi:hypothetical protein